MKLTIKFSAYAVSLFLAVAAATTPLQASSAGKPVVPGTAAPSSPASAAAPQSGEKSLPKPEVVKFQSDSLDRIAELLAMGLAQVKISDPAAFGISRDDLANPKGKTFHAENATKHNGSELANSLAVFADRDWKAKSSAGLSETRVLFWTDGQMRQHSAAIKIEWWIGEEEKYHESYVRYSLDHLWLETGKGEWKAFPISLVSRELIYSQPAGTNAPANAGDKAPKQTKK